MAEASIALNRFGLGGHAGEAVPAEPRKWLLDQLSRYDPRPPVIASLPTTKVIAKELADYLA